MTDFKKFTQEYQQRINRFLDQHLPAATQEPQRLHKAMRYSVLNGGKRIRPLLVYAVANTFNAPLEHVDAAAAAVEMIHCYSLIHDDLPAMDDDDLRRGQPTCHKAFDEATAILAGDALQALAFEVAVLRQRDLAAEQILKLTQVLAQACGSQGMAGGQALDLAATNQQFDLAYVENMHRRKTGALITASAVMGAIVGGAAAEQQVAIQQYGDLIGLAFQIQDDILDIEGETVVLGKTQGADVAANKLTYPAVAGMKASRLKVQQLYQSAIDSLAKEGLDTPLLRELSAFLVQRSQ